MLPVIALGIVIDQLIKLSIVSTMALGQTQVLLPGLTLTFALNKGVAFGLFAAHQDLAFYSLNIVIIFFNLMLIEMLSQAAYGATWYRAGIAMVVTGGLSNLIDRCCYGAVVDYITFEIAGMHWPTIFNVADMLICLGCLLWLISCRHESGMPVNKTAQTAIAS